MRQVFARRRRDLMIASALSAFAVAQPALAAEENDQQHQEEARGLDEIIVTANRREERLQDVPLAVSVMTPDALRRDNITSNQDLAGKIPSLVVGQAVGQRDSQTFTVRGQGATFGGGPGVAVYFAEVALPQRNDTVGQLGTGTLFFDLQNVQVLKGPQGTLFGRNTTGGAVLFEPAKPKDQFEGSAQLQIGNFNDREFEGMINVPIVSDKLMLRVAGRYASRDGFTRDVKTGYDMDNRNYWSGRASLMFRPTETVENYLVVSTLKVDQHGTGSVIVGFNSGVNPANGALQGSVARRYGLPLLAQVLAEQQARGPRLVDLNIVPSEQQRMTMVTDQLSIQLGDHFKLRNIASYARYKTRADFDQDGSRLPVSDNGPGTEYSTNARQWTEEVQLQGNLLDDKLNTAVGFYHEDAKSLGPEVRAGLTNGAFGGIVSGEHRRSTGVYAQAALDMGALTPALEGLRLTGGFRYTWDKKDSFYKFKSGDLCVLTIAVAPECLVERQLKSRAPTWLAALDYKLTSNVMVYGKVSRGYKGGGFNFNGSNPAALLFQPEYITAYELGFKSDWQLGQVPLRLNVAGHSADYTDIQKVGSSVATLPNGVVTGGSATVNAGSARIRGIEVEATIEPVRNFAISGGYSYSEGKYKDFKFVYLVGGVPTIDDKTAVPFSFLPKNQFSISASYKIELTEKQSITPSLTFSHIDSYYTQITDPAQEPFGYLPQSNLLNMRVSWDNVGDRPLDLAFFMTNVANKTFPIQLQTNYGKNGASYGSGFARYVYSEPRMYGVQLRYRFGAAE